MRRIVLICLLFISVKSFAQSCVSSFTASSGKSDITLNWTLNSNCSCPQVTLEWSIDSLFSNPTIIYTGADNSYDHTTPDMSKTNYYRLNSCGYYSQTIAIRVGGLNYLFYPNPVNSSSGFMANIVFQNPYNNYYNLYIFDHNGQLMRVSGLFAGTTFQFYTEGLQAGLYLFVIASTTISNIAASGKFYVAYN